MKRISEPLIGAALVLFYVLTEAGNKIGAASGMAQDLVLTSAGNMEIT